MNEAKQKDPQALQCQTGHEKITSKTIIPQKSTLLGRFCDGDLIGTERIYAEVRNYVRVCDLVKV
jgi:hypothetical protein